MEELKSIDCELLGELIKDGRRSDKQLAKILRVSQPTVTRRRAKLEKDLVQGYTAVPNFGKLGFEIVAFTFVRGKYKTLKSEELERAKQERGEWLMKQPNCIFAAFGKGMGWDGVCISFHRSYSDLATFTKNMNAQGSVFIEESQNFVVPINPGMVMKPFHFKYLAKSLQPSAESKEEESMSRSNFRMLSTSSPYRRASSTRP